MMSAKLVERWWAWRTFGVTCGEKTFAVKYHPWGWSSESVSVDDVVVARRTGTTMSHTFQFPLGGHQVSLRVAVPWWAEIIPFSDLSYVRLEFAGRCLYEEGLAPEETLDRPPATDEP